MENHLHGGIQAEVVAKVVAEEEVEAAMISPHSVQAGDATISPHSVQIPGLTSLTLSVIVVTVMAIISMNALPT